MMAAQVHKVGEIPAESEATPTLTSSLTSDWRVGQRISVTDHLATIRYIGTIPATLHTNNNAEVGVSQNKNSWLGVEWDDVDRGKHNGDHNGVSYFKPSIENSNSASFIRPNPSKILFARDFLEVLVDKYFTPDAHTEQSKSASEAPLASKSKHDLTLGKTGIVVETVGWAKINQKQNQLHQIHQVGLKQCRIGVTASPEGAILDTCSGIIDLDLSRNLFEDFATVARICRELPRLESLRLSFNRFRSGVDGMVILPQVTTLVLNNVNISWNFVLDLEPFFPNLTDLHLGWNRIEVLTPNLDPTKTFRKLKHLNLEHNQLSSWSCLDSISRLESLTTLVLNDNTIQGIVACGPEVFSNLTTLNLSDNKIQTWMEIHHLNSFPRLVELRIRNNPVLGLVTQHAGVGANLKGLEHYILVSRVEKLAVLNGSTITAPGRVEAERYYMAEMGRDFARLCFEDDVKGQGKITDEFLALHPRYHNLVQIHGEIVVAAGNSSNKLVDRLLSLTLVHVAKGTVITRKLLPNMSTRTVKMVLSKVFGCQVRHMKLVGVYTKNGERVEMDDEGKELIWWGLESGDRVLVETPS